MVGKKKRKVYTYITCHNVSLNDRVVHLAMTPTKAYIHDHWREPVTGIPNDLACFLTVTVWLGLGPKATWLGLGKGHDLG